MSDDNEGGGTRGCGEIHYGHGWDFDAKAKEAKAKVEKATLAEQQKREARIKKRKEDGKTHEEKVKEILNLMAKCIGTLTPKEDWSIKYYCEYQRELYKKLEEL